MIAQTTGGEEKIMSSLMSKFIFWFSVIVLAFLPGGIFISVFLLALYYLLPSLRCFDQNKVDSSSFDDSRPHCDMKAYSQDTLEGMK